MTSGAKATGQATTVVLIGPVAVGKTTVGRLLGGRLELPFVDVDEVADPYYEAAGRTIHDVMQRLPHDGLFAAFAWWEPAIAAAAAQIVADNVGSVIAFGAGHSHFTDDDCFDVVRSVVERVNATVVLLRCHNEPDAAVEALRRRSINDREMDWLDGDIDIIANWVRSEQNERLAAFSVTTDGRTPDDVAALIEAELRASSAAS